MLLCTATRLRLAPLLLTRLAATPTRSAQCSMSGEVVKAQIASRPEGGDTIFGKISAPTWLLRRI